jgi:hypothetical protein
MDATTVGLIDDRPRLHEKSKEPSSASGENSRKRSIRRLHAESYKVLNNSARDLNCIEPKDEESKTRSTSRKDPLSQSEHVTDISTMRRSTSQNSRRESSRRSNRTDPLSQSEHILSYRQTRSQSSRTSRRKGGKRNEVDSLSQSASPKSDAVRKFVSNRRSHSGPQRPLDQRPMRRRGSGGLPIRTERRKLAGTDQSEHVRGKDNYNLTSPQSCSRRRSSSSGARPVSAGGDHVRGKDNYNLTSPRSCSRRRSSSSGARPVSAGGDRLGNLSQTSNVRETTLELLDLIKRRRRKAAANLMSPMRNQQKLSSHASLPKVAPPLIPSQQQTMSDDDDIQESPKCVLEFPFDRKRASPETERQILEEARRKEEEDRKMRLEIASMKQRLEEMEQQKQDDLVQLKQSMEEHKAKLKNEAKTKLAEHLETEMELQQLAMDAEKNGIAIEELEAEQIELQATVAEIQEMNDGMVEENEKLKAANNKLFRMYTGLSQWVKKKTRHNKKLVEAETKLLKILKGCISLIAEARQSRIYRKWMYKCAFGVNSSDFYHFQLDEEIMAMIQECETECNEEVIALNDIDAWNAQHEQERDPLHDIMFGSRGINTTSSQEVPTSPLSAEGLDPMDLSDDDDECFDKNMDELDQSMAVYENILAEISVKLDATQMSTLYENKHMLLTIFRFLDTDGSGDIDPEEFRLGIELLNKRLPEESHFQEHEELFQLLDVDGNGTIDIMEFEKIFVDD